MHILILNGPNLNRLGLREPHLYGHRSFEQYLALLQAEFPQHTLSYHQSNHEGQLIDWLHHYGDQVQGIVFNPGAYTHTSVALGDAVASISAPVIEVHITNTQAREAFRHTSFIAPKALGTITGLGLEGYRLALLHFFARQ